MRVLLLGLVGLAALALLVVGGVWLYVEWIANPRTVRELIEHPGGARAERVMVLTLPSGREIPINYLREDEMIYAAADGRWWRELAGDGVPVTVLVRGETLAGRGRAVLDDPAYTKRVFARLRPNAIEGFGTLIEIRLERAEHSSPAAPAR